jgi:hypothetical protein
MTSEPLDDDRLERILAHVPNCRYGCIACESAPALIADLRELRRRLDDLGDQAVERMAARLMEDMRLRSLEIRGGSFEMDITEAREMCALFVGAARAMLGDAPNYTETRVDFPTARVEFEVKISESFDSYVLTVQRAGKLTPHEARKQAEKERDEALERVADLEAQLAETREELDQARTTGWTGK